MDNRLRIGSFSLNEERDAWLFLNTIPEIGPVRFHHLLHAARSARAILELSITGLQAAGASPDLAERWHRAFRDPRHQHWLDAELKRVEQAEVSVVTELDPEYPDPLRELIDRPPVLYVKGHWPLPGLAVGLVGTRRASAYGLGIARQLATDLVAKGATIVSGLALGIDACVHEATLQAGGKTIAVLGCGLAHRYPRENAKLYERIAESGLLVTEFSFEAPPDSRNFPRRNRIISGLSKGIVVIEAGLKSGALITARYAAEQGRDVFAVPGNVLNPANAGSHMLIKQGARLVETVDDVMMDLSRDSQALRAQGVSKPLPGEPAGAKRSALEASLNSREEEIFSMLSDVPRSVEQIVESTTQRFEDVFSTLLELELKGAVLNLPGQRYVRNY